MASLTISRNSLISSTTVAGIIFTLLTLLTSPESIGPFGVLVWLLLLYIVAINVVGLIWVFVKKRPLTLSGLFRILGLSLLGFFLLGLHSLNQLHIRDVMVIGALSMLLSFYVSHRYRSK